MRKVTIKSLKRKLDKVFGEIIRSRGVCARCGKGAERVTLHCAHIMSRKNMSVRWDFDNALALCYHCHFWWAHKEPVLFTEFCKEYLGEERFSQLIMKSTMIKKWKTWELEELINTYKQKLNDLPSKGGVSELQ